MQPEPLVFHQDRADLALRAYPRLAVGTAGLCLVILLSASIAVGGPPPWGGLALGAAIWVGSIGTRFDVIALQFGRPVVYVLHEDRFEAWRGKKAVASFLYADVDEWWAAYGARRLAYWVGRGYTRGGWPVRSLDQFRFHVTPEGEKARTVEPPALFRWEDRGGLDDVVKALTERIGPARNR